MNSTHRSYYCGVLSVGVGGILSFVGKINFVNDYIQLYL